MHMMTSEGKKQDKPESMAVAVDMPPVSSSPEFEKAPEPFLSRLNNFLHSNIYVYLITYYLYWLGFWLFMPLAGFFTMLGFGLYDLFTAKGLRKPCGPVLITGTSSGFGLDLTLQLAAQGWKVYACVRKGADMAPFSRYPNVKGLIVDVTKEEQIHAAIATVEAECPEGLYALVNNAGYEQYGTTDWCGLDYFKLHMDVNYYGPIRLTKAALPLLKKHGKAGKESARIININSTSGLLPGLPLKAGYSASKHAAEAWSNSLRQEMRRFNIEVTVVNPSWHATRCALPPKEKLLASFRAAPAEVQADYGEEYVLEAAEEAYNGRQWFTWNPENVGRVMLWAVTAEKYRPQYLVGMDARFVNMPFLALPRRIMNNLEDGTPFAKMLPAGAVHRD